MSNNGCRGKEGAPEGFRPLTAEELAKHDELLFKMTILRERMDRLDQIVRAAKIEIKAAELEKEICRRELDDLKRSYVHLRKTLGIVDPNKDQLDVDGTLYVRTREDARGKDVGL
jgi:outer membrane murein-binding lipoprotein Lpp